MTERRHNQTLFELQNLRRTCNEIINRIIPCETKTSIEGDSAFGEEIAQFLEKGGVVKKYQGVDAFLIGTDDDLEPAPEELLRPSVVRNYQFGKSLYT